MSLESYIMEIIVRTRICLVEIMVLGEMIMGC